MIAYWQQHLAPVLASKLVLLASAFSATSSFIVADLLTADRTYAFILCAFSTMATAYFTSRPRLIAAQAAREASRHVNNEKSAAALIENLHYEIERKTSEISLIRISKHNALNALQAAYWHIDELRQILRYGQPQLALPEFTKISIKEIFGDEDQQLKAMISEVIRRRTEREDEGGTK